MSVTFDGKRAMQQLADFIGEPHIAALQIRRVRAHGCLKSCMKNGGGGCAVEGSKAA